MSTTRSGNGRSGQPDSYASGARNGGRRSPAQYGGQQGQARGYATPPAKAAPRHAVNTSKPALRIGVAALLLVIAVVAAIGIFRNIEKNNLYASTFTAGVRINGEDVSGLDVEEYRSRLKQQFQQRIADISVKVTYGEQSWPLSGVDLGATDNVDSIVDQAAALARTGSQEQRAEEARRVKAEGRDFTAELALDESALQVKLNAIAAGVSVSGRNATVSFNPDAMSFKDPEEPTEKELKDLEKMFTINEEVAGLAVDVDMMAQKIAEDLKGDYRSEQELLVTQFVPSVTAEKLRESFRFLSVKRTKISSASTEEREHNITLALSKFNGLVLQPQQEISFNDTTGPRTEANGYMMAHVINDGAYVDDWGGGVCQASTTLYNAALLAGCEIVERDHHSIPSDYVPKGFDAMVNYPNQDFKFKNTSAGPIYIKAWVSAKRNAYVMFFGMPLADCAYLKAENDIIFEGPLPGWEVVVDKDGAYAGQYTDNVTLEDGTKIKGCVTMSRHPELTVDAYLISVDANGKEIGRKKLYQDKFKVKKGTVYVPAEEPTPKPTKTPKPSPSPTTQEEE
jgi:vancomycin resistance protein YoaR